MDNIELVLMMKAIRGIGDQTISAVLRRNAIARRSPDEFLALPIGTLTEEYGIRRAAAGQLSNPPLTVRSKAEADAHWLRRTGIRLLTVMDATYPARLVDRLDVPPPALFSYGNAELLNGPLFAVANSNGAPEAALAAGDRAAEAACGNGWSLVSGHNRIPYQRAALAVRRNGGRVCYVLDRGIRAAYGHDLSQALFPAARIWGPTYDPACDLTLSPFGLDDHGAAGNNRRRDTLIFALADTIYAGFLRPGGTMEAECEAAARSGRTVVHVAEAGQG